MTLTSLDESSDKLIAEFHRLQRAGLINKRGQFFPSVHYPPITMYSPIDQETLLNGFRNPDIDLFDIYVHIPFCMRYCSFCHYPVRIGADAKEKERYLKALIREMDIYMALLGIKKFRARSILFGGGTPTFLSPAQLESFLDSFVERVDVSDGPQFSYDVDPVTLIDADGPQRMKILKAHGVGRLTIGIQSFDDGILRAMHRPHDKAEALRAIKAAQDAGFKLNIEFIYGYFNQTQEQWADTLRQAIDTGVDEIQLYKLKIAPYGDHEGVVFKKAAGKEAARLPSPEESLKMKFWAMDYLQGHGYHENLRRVFSRTKEDFSHYADNQCCGLFDGIGFGLTAFSSLHDRFGLNTMDFEKYYTLIHQGRLPVDRGLVRCADDQRRWAIVLPLKNRRVWKKYYKQVAGASLHEVFRPKIESLKAFGLLKEDEKRLELTPLGVFFADEVSHCFHHPRYMPFPAEDYSQGALNPYNTDGKKHC